VRLAVPREEGVRLRRAVIDPAGTLPGRGAYLCRRAEAGAVAAPNPDCLSLAVSRRGIARALRCAVAVDPKLVESTVE
jgi:predicted RNA-binding protein YlxR (DUF448 family)